MWCGLSDRAWGRRRKREQRGMDRTRGRGKYGEGKSEGKSEREDERREGVGWIYREGGGERGREVREGKELDGYTERGREIYTYRGRD